jgi:hypothetical protein
MPQSDLVIGLIVVVVVGFVLVRRIRPQPVNPTRMAVTALIFVVLLLFSLVSTGSAFVHDTPALIASPFALIAGAAIGWALVRLMRFWTDPQTGLLWMRGGIIFAVIYIVTLLLRFGSVFVSGDHALTSRYSWLEGVSADLVFLSIGLWITRVTFVLLRYRQHLAQGGAPAASGQIAR